MLRKIEEVKVDIADAKLIEEECKDSLKGFESDHAGLFTETDFIEYAKKCVAGAREKYQSLFSDDTNLARLKKAYRACKVFDVLYLRSGPSVETR